MNSNTTIIRSMMRPYEGRDHAVVAFHLKGETLEFLHAGAQISDLPCEDWVFEIGSITKVFTAILMCLLAEEGKVDPHAPLKNMADMLNEVPPWITPERLITHTSGLPNYFKPLWKALLRPEPDGPYANFSRADLIEWFQRHGRRAKPPKVRHAYSNLGVGLLGEAMAIMEGKPFTKLLAESVTAPLGMRDTMDHCDPRQYGRFAPPRWPNGKTAPAWVFQSLAAAGCLRSTCGDLARFSKAVIRALDAPQTRLDHAICRSTQPLLGLGPKGDMTPVTQCSGWLQVTLYQQRPGFLFHNGATAGSSAALYINPRQNAAIGILSNNGVAGHLWRRAKLNRSKPMQQVHDLFMAA